MTENSTPSPIDKIGSFEIKTVLRDTGDIQTYYAYDMAYGHDVVLKLFPSNFFTTPSFRGRFEREMQSLVLDQLPGIAPVYDLGDLDSRPYLARAFMPGGSLVDLLSQGFLPFEDVVAINNQIAASLDLLHKRGFFHRNLKPNNVLFDEDGNVYLADLDQIPPPSLQEAGVLNSIGSFTAYSPPERGLGIEEDQRADVYSLAAIVYTMLTGKEPFQGSSIEQLAQKMSSLPPSPQKYRPDLPPPAAVTIQWGMAADPEKRYGSAGLFAATFASSVGMPWQIERTAKPVKEVNAPRHPTWRFRFALLAFILLLIIGGLAGFYARIFDLDKAQGNVSGYFYHPTPTATTTPTPTVTLTPTATSTRTLTPTPTVPTATPTYTETPTIEKPSSTPLPSPTPTSILGKIVLGMADKIAVIHNNEIYVANLDGSNREQWTTNKGNKSDLQWTPDGRGLIYRHNNCYKLITYPDRQELQLGCFEDLELSPDMVRSLIGATVVMENETKRWMSFLAPIDLVWNNLIREVPQKSIMGGCPFFGGRQMHFSLDGELLAGIFSTPNGDEIQIINLRDCNGFDDYKVRDTLPGSRFTLRFYSGSNEKKELTDFAWDGVNVLILHGNYIKGYGDFVVYYRNTGRSVRLNPIDQQCCYRDMEFSPDGAYVTFSFWDVRYNNAAQVYVLPFNELDPKITYQPIPFPSDFFQDPKAWPEPALRPAIP